MFDQLDVRPELKATPRLLVLALVYMLLFGVLIGILIGRRRWDAWSWADLVFWGAILCRTFFPIHAQIANRLRDQNGE